MDNSKLKNKKCKIIKKTESPFNSTEVEEMLHKINKEWQNLNSSKIKRTFICKNFLEAVKIINKIAEIVDPEDHHPDISLYNYKYLDIVLTTHIINGLSENDFIIASKIDQILN